ncbi:metabotropic glycine receptor-like [Conger conger]|uniref:metabotropic glycine receptor-like n=1 Tax=Conger conger TaxID=82655 RepID=UPI002A5A82B2|nr:metabotropic glycine receptor-like [Conger conger]
MAIFLISLLLPLGLAVGSNYGYVEWSEQDKDLDSKVQHTVPNTNINKEPQHHPTYITKPWTERTVVAHRIEEDLPRVVTAFLHTGDSSTLQHVNCSRRYELSSLRGRSYIAPHYPLHSVLETVAHATNFLNVILQTNSSREHTVRRDIMWYHALVRSILEGDPKIYRAVVTFNTESPTPGPHIFLQATRTEDNIVLQDLSTTAHHRLKNKSPETEWFNEFRDKKQTHVRRRMSSQDVKVTDAAVRRGDRYVLNKTQIKWSAPYLECENGNFIPHWLLTLSAGFYSLKPNLTPEFRGVVRVDVNLQDVDIDQCSSSGWFAGTHRCNLTTMECQPIAGHGFVLDQYKCHCKRGFYHPGRLALNGFKRTEKSGGRQHGGVSQGPAKCLPCREGCGHCRDDAPCHTQQDPTLRTALISCQALCMLGDLISMVVAYNFRRNKRIRASGLVLIEAILFGALLLYFPVGVLYFRPSVFRCILLRWVRVLGFAVVYGTVILKLYRVLKVFLSRSAQRIPYMTSCRVLRLLAVILLVVIWFLVSWTLSVCQNTGRNLALIHVGITPEGLQFSMCLLDRWDYMIAIAEFLFLLWGVYLCYAVRTVPSAFHEPRYLAVAIYNELVISAIFHIIRFTLAPALHPDWMLMLVFAHTHLTVTITLGLLLIPKFLFTGTHTRDDIATEAYEDELDMGRSGSYLNSSITSAWSEHSLDPEDIREELKKLYSQLEVYKRKKMLANNPHLQKKRSSKKGLGRSLMRRITEIPETVSRQCSREDKDHQGEHGGTRNSICTLRRNPFDPSHASKHKVFSLQKSHSSYDHVRDQGEDKMAADADKMEASTTESSLLDPLAGQPLQRKEDGGGGGGEEKAEGESTESVPLVCKSASAHNLTAEKKPAQLRTSMLQKSLSVIASARGKTLGLTGKIHGVGEDGRKSHHHRAKDSSKGCPEPAETPQRYPKMPVSQSVEYKQTASKVGIMKPQVSGSQPSICSEPGRSKELYDLSEVCPWELEDLPTPSEGKVQKHVSIAPGETTTVHGTTVKGRPGAKQRGSDHQSPSSSSRRPHQRPLERLNICPWEEEEEGVVEGGPKPQSPRSRSDKGPQRPEMCLWGPGAPPGGAKVLEGGLSPDRSRRKKSVTPTEGKEKVLHSDHSKSTGSLLQPPGLRVDICPWDYDTPPSSPNADRAATHAPRANDSSHPKRKGSGASAKTLEREKGRDKDDGRRRSKSKEKSLSGKSTEKRRVSQSKMADGCPCDGGGGGQGDCRADRRKSSSSEAGSAYSKQAEISPRDFESIPDSRSTKQRPPSLKAGVPANAKMADVCPWDFEDKMLGKNA